MTAGRIPEFRVEGPRPAFVQDQEWECADCGWSIDASHLVPGWTVDQARVTHGERYCARPPIWP